MKQRKTSRWIEPRKDKDGNLLCLIPTCNKLREKYKTCDRTRNYCEDHDSSDLSEFNSWPHLRLKAFKRDNNTCKYCKKQFEAEDLVGDHIIPIALGGDEFDIDNIQTLCKATCNKIKTKQDQKDIAKQRRSEKPLEEDDPSKIKALCIKEPYASLIRSGEKDIETRTWNTKVRGEILLCASKIPKSDISGNAFATAILIDTRLMRFEDEKRACCNFIPGLYSWILINIKPIDPIPIKGQLRFFEVIYGTTNNNKTKI